MQDLVRERIGELYADARIRIEGEGCNLELVVISEGFAGMPVLRRQKDILKLFEAELKSGALHALSIRARTPAEVAASSSTLVQLQM